MTNSKECVIVGNRPDIIKMAPLILKMKPFLVHTGQHEELANNVFDIFNISPDVNLKLMQHNQTLSDFINTGLMQLDVIIKHVKPKRIWVLGDTSTAYIGAIVASLNQIELVHVEAGLRTFDKKNPFPEEIFRLQIDSIADILFAPMPLDVENLKKENVQGKIYLVGNTVVDALEMIKPQLPVVRPIKEKYVLATVHRRESFGKDMFEIFSALKELSKKIKVILPAHSNPNVQEMIKKVGLKIVKPMNYVDFLWHLRDCEYVISDSGGVLEEVSSFGKKIVVLRKTTERQEIIENGYGILIKKMEKNYILSKIKDFSKKNIIINKNPFGDGKSSEKIIKIIKKLDDVL